jgi:hypothetical protein
MGSWQDWVAIVIAFLLRDFIEPFRHPKGCGSCGGCGIGNSTVLKIEASKR